jgi:hypothetical protein
VSCAPAATARSRAALAHAAADPAAVSSHLGWSSTATRLAPRRRLLLTCCRSGPTLR